MACSFILEALTFSPKGVGGCDTSGRWLALSILVLQGFTHFQPGGGVMLPHVGGLLFHSLSLQGFTHFKPGGGVMLPPVGGLLFQS